MNPPPALVFARHFARARWQMRHLRGKSLARYHDVRGSQVAAYAAAHSPFYREIYSGRDLLQWQTLPTVDKAAMMANFDTFNTRGVSRDAAMAVALKAERSRDFEPMVDGLTVGLSSGTSGHRGLFLVDRGEQAAWAGTMLARVLPAWRRRGFRVALFSRSNSNLYESVRRSWLSLRYFDLMAPLAECTLALNAERPDILVAPPSKLLMLAEARRRGALRARPSQIFSVAEVLEPQDAECIEAAFETRVGQIYQCTEGLLGVSCRHGRLHIQEDLVHLGLEPFPAPDNARRATPIVTDLWRRTQPIIRYRLNDLLTLDPRPCPCGSAFRVIERIEGRADDVCYFEAVDGGMRAFFPDVIRRMILMASDRIEDYQAFQEAPAQLRIHVRVSPGASLEEVATALRLSVAEIAAGYGAVCPALTIEEGLVALEPGRKLRRVQRVGWTPEP
jgi:putative adenylate-forming enzyme